ncbi:hypothetical protein KBT16_00125 [Nostoc sp. CCCryo 231-06]|nr:hypothetical protein [Nostoc sp. CCCryo 231-06]
MLVICDCYLTTISQTLEIFVYYTMKCGMWGNKYRLVNASATSLIQTAIAKFLFNFTAYIIP